MTNRWSERRSKSSSEPGSTLYLTSTTTYDGAGRVDTQTYPQLPTSNMAGLSVKHTYTAYGQLGALSNAGTGYVYWVGQGENAWGHVTAEQYPGVITGSYSDYLSTGQSKTLSWSGGTSDQVSYAYDGFGNLMSQQRSAGAATNTETYTYDSLQRLTKAARAIGDPVTYTYSNSGNIVSKSDNGTTNYVYGGTSTGCGPHAVTSANGLSYTCDANGNVIGGAITAVYDADNHPRSIVRNPAIGMMNWSYSTLGGMTTELSGQGLRYFGPNGYEQVGVGNGAKQVHELGPVVVTRTGGVDSVSVLLRDRLGSTISVVDNNVPTTRTYDAFGKARNGDMGNRENGTLDLDKTIHGFTKHDHADEVRLIHMGGRVYDYQLGRFLNVDPLIQSPANSQNLNPYSYILNNPLAGKDPTGYACSTGTHISGANGPACSTLGVHSIQIGSPSKSQTDAAKAQSNSGASAGQGTQVRTEQQKQSTSLGNPTVQAPKVAGQGVDAPQGQDSQSQTSSAGLPMLPTVKAIVEPQPNSMPRPIPWEQIVSLGGRLMTIARIVTGVGGIIYTNPAGDACECACGSTTCGPNALPVAPPMPNSTPGFGDADGIRGPTAMLSDQSDATKVPVPGVSGKEGAKDVPSWAKGERPKVGESGKSFADRLLGGKYGKGNYPTGPGSEWSKIRKWGDRSFVDPK